jgi:PilX N-terminal
VKKHREQGMALITALLVLMLVSSMIVGLAWMVMTDQKLAGNNSDRQKAFYAAEAGMESITAALAADFNASPVLSSTDINNIMTTTSPADMASNNITYISHAANAPCGTNGYCITFTPDPNGNPLATTHTILTGQNAGLVGLLTPYTLQVTAVTPQGSEVKLQRVVQTAAIPIFQFGMFSQTDLDFFAGPDFSFGGRVHTNGNLWLAENGGTLTLSDKVTAAGEIIRSNLENGTSTSSSYNTTVSITTNPGSGPFVALTTGQGSESGPNVINTLSGSYWTPFTSLSTSTYNGNIGVKETGIAPLNVGIATPSIGGQSIDLIRMPVVGELTSNPAKLSERYYSLASLRIMLSDYDSFGGCGSTSDIMTMPNISAGNPVDLASLAWDGAARPGSLPAVAAWYQAAGGYSLPMSAAGSALVYTPTDGYWIQPHYPIITGCIKVDYQNTGNTWVDVTQEILKLGLTGRNINPQGLTVLPPLRPALPGAQQVASGPTINGGVVTVASSHNCIDPSPNAVIRLARVRDNPSFSPVLCVVTNPPNTTTYGSDFWPNVLYDTREGLTRDDTPALNPIVLRGVMNYVELDVNNLARWFSGTIGASGGNAIKITGYTVYFSDRRGDRADTTAGGPPTSVVGSASGKTGAFGFEDFVDPASAYACPNGALDQGEDVEGDYTSGTDTTPVLRTYGAAPAFPNPTVGVPITNLAPLSLSALLAIKASTYCLTTTQWPGLMYSNTLDARENPPLLFRRALKLVNGSTISAGICDTVQCGLTIAAENPVYVQGDYNAQPNGVLNTTYVGASVIADAVTLLSDNFNDVNSFAFPYALGSRIPVATTYRMAVIGGKGVPFPIAPVTGTAAADYGTDGGAHNFLRYLEYWSGVNVYYTGSIVSLYYNHQATGIYKCCNTVYGAPSRHYLFDTQFLTPINLPPQTPMLRSLNTISMTQLDLSTQ